MKPADSARLCITNRGMVHPLFDQTLASSLRYAAANGKIIIEMISVTHLALMIFIIRDNLPDFFIPFDKIFAAEIRSLLFQFFYKSAGCALSNSGKSYHHWDS